MAIYTDEEALDKAIELIDTALSAGSLAPIVPSNMGNAEASGKKVGEYIGAAVEALRDKLKTL